MNDKENEFINMINHFDYEHSSDLFKGLFIIALSGLIIQLYTLATESKQNERKRIKG